MNESNKPSLLERLSALLMREPEDREQLVKLLHSAFERNLLDGDALSMIEGALQVSEMQVRDIMVPRSQMDVIDVNETPEKFIPHVIATAHSRFPVIDRNRDDAIGILLAKDLLRYYAGEEEFNLRDMLRPAVFVPEQIVGDIEDEYDFDESEDNIVREQSGYFRVKAQTEIADFNKVFGTQFSGTEFDTVGGLVLHRFGRLPKRGEAVTIGGLRFQVLRGDSRRLHVLQVQRLPGKT